MVDVVLSTLVALLKILLGSGKSLADQMEQMSKFAGQAGEHGMGSKLKIKTYRKTNIFL